MYARRPTTRTARPALPAAPRSRRAGLSLLELLIVLVILMMVTAAAIPIMAPALQNRQMREGSRLVSTYLNAARARAMQTGRPVGVMFERFNGLPFSMQLSQVEIPPPYAGDTYSSLMEIALSNGGNSPNAMQSSTALSDRFGGSMTCRWYTAKVFTDTFNNRLVRIGDHIQFGNQGHLFTIFGPDTNGDGMLDDAASGMPLVLDIGYLYPNGTNINHLSFPWDNMTPVPQRALYQVFRQPVRTAAQPLQLPEGIVVDLISSGAGTSGAFNSRSYTTQTPNPPDTPLVVFDPIVVFSPSGRLDWVTEDTAGRLVRPTDMVYFLMGRRELMYDATTKNQGQDIVDQNLSPVTTHKAADGILPAPPAHFWVCVGPQTGQVTVSEVAANLQDITTPMIDHQLVIDASLEQARTLARQSQSVGGR